MELKQELHAGDEIPIQIAPFGEYPATTIDGKEIVQRFDKASFDKIVEDWRNTGEKLIRADFDHKSEMTDDTIASGWIKDLSVDNDKGLIGTLVVTESGAKALNGLDYRFGSPVFSFDETEHPVSLLSYAFTNRPRLDTMDAVWNSERPTVQNLSTTSKIEQKVLDSKPGMEDNVLKAGTTEPAEKTEPETQTDQTDTINTAESNPEKETHMESLKIVLGLPAEATEEDILNSVKELVDKVKAIADEEIKAEAEEAVNECGIEDEKKEEVINCYKQNPQLVKSVLNAFKAKPAKLVINSAEAVKPALTEDEKLKAEYATLRGGKEKRDWLIAHPGVKL